MFNLITNIKALESSNVETVIVFQTLTSLAVAYGDYRFLNSSIPSTKVIVSLSIIVIGAVLFVYNNTLQINAFTWVILYFIAKVSDMLYIKHIIDTVPMTNFGRSYYNNLLAAPFALFLAILSERNKIGMALENLTFNGFFILFLSCIMGIGISLAGLMCREAVSATSFSVIGNMNKILTVLINYTVMKYLFSFYLNVFFRFGHIIQLLKV